ncbi:MAG: WG repeat-containing protein [Saprospiraceae bacterium]
MKPTIKNHFQFLFLLSFLLAFTACKQAPGDKAKEASNPSTPTTATSLPLTMEQTNDGKWVILDSQKKPVYEVFIYDNGPDYEADGLIRIIKNGKIGYADAKTFVIVIEPQFDCAFPFENGKAKVSNQCKTVKDGEYSVWESEAWQYVDKQGKF